MSDSFTGIKFYRVSLFVSEADRLNVVET